MLKMIGFDIGDDECFVINGESRAITFVGLQHKPFTLGPLRVNPELADIAANKKCRVKTRF